MNRLRFFLGSVVLVLTAAFALAQTGSIGGTVTDSAGAVVQGAEITVRNMGSNATRTATSSGTGAYSVPSLPPGVYEVTAKMASFKAFHAPDVQLTVGQALPLDIRLEPGAVTEEVQVRADQISDVDLETSQVSNLVDEEKIKALPLITRNPYELVLLSPGSSQANSSWVGSTSTGRANVTTTSCWMAWITMIRRCPASREARSASNPENAEEFRVVTDNFNAEYGRNTGAIIDVVTKGGTNKIHFDAYWFGRYNKIGGARDWFNPATGPSGGPAKSVRAQPVWILRGWPDSEGQDFLLLQSGVPTFPHGPDPVRGCAHPAVPDRKVYLARNRTSQSGRSH